MKRFSLRHRFILYFLPLVFCIVFFGGYYIYILSNIHDQLARLHQDVTPNALAILELKGALSSLDKAVKEKQVDKKQIQAEILRLETIISSLGDHKSIINSEDKPSHDMMHKAIRAMGLSNYVLKQNELGWQDDNLSEISDIIHRELVALGPILDQHLKIHLSDLSRAEAYVSKQYQNSRVFVVCSIVLMSLFAVVIFVAMMRSILDPVMALKEGAKQIGEGNLDYVLNVNSGDELEFLAMEFQEMAVKLAVSHADLDRRVKERTKELSCANESLQKEIVQRRKAQDEQLRAEEQVHSLTQDLFKIQETERQQISLDLHDNVAQELSALKVAGESLWKSLDAEGNPHKHDVHEWGKLLDRCVKTIRELSYNLRPPGLEQMGLSSAVLDYTRNFTKKTGIVVNYSSAGIEPLALDYTFAITIYRLIQEALNNIDRHADASKAEVRLIASHPNIILRVEDDGQGFDIEKGFLKAQQNKRFGLLGMQERVRMLNGEFRIRSAPWEGTKIFIEIPCGDTYGDN